MDNLVFLLINEQRIDFNNTFYFGNEARRRLLYVVFCYTWRAAFYGSVLFFNRNSEFWKKKFFVFSLFIAGSFELDVLLLDFI